jgi:hypothetical protein
MVEVSSVKRSVVYGKILSLSRQRLPYYGVPSDIGRKLQSAVQVNCNIVYLHPVAHRYFTFTFYGPVFVRLLNV